MVLLGYFVFLMMGICHQNTGMTGLSQSNALKQSSNSDPFSFDAFMPSADPHTWIPIGFILTIVIMFICILCLCIALCRRPKIKDEPGGSRARDELALKARDSEPWSPSQIDEILE